MANSNYIPPSDSSSSEDEMNVSQGSQTSFQMEHESITPTCEKDLRAFHFPEPRSRRSITYNRKRKFRGNQHSKGSESSTDSADASQSAPEIEKLSTPASRKLDFPYTVRKAKLSVVPVSNKDETVFEKVAKIDGNLLISADVLQEVITQMAVCSSCQLGKLKIYNQSSMRSGCALYIMMRCDSCYVSKTFWTVSGKFRSKIQIGEHQIPKRNDLIYSSILGGRLVGMGWNSLKFYHATLGIPQPCNSDVFVQAVKSLALAAEEIARCSMDNARDSLRKMLKVDPSISRFSALASYDGSYQVRGGKAGGGHSRYCFAAAISTMSKQVLAYGIACNSCPICNQYANRLRNGEISDVEYAKWEENHKLTCPAEYAHLSSVQLESAIAPQVVQQALSRGIMFSGLVCDGDAKTHDALSDANLYRDIEGAGEIERIECLAHVCKRLKSNLIKKHEKEMKTARADKAADVRRLTKQGSSQKEIAKRINPEYRGKLITQTAPRLSWSRLQDSKEIKHLSPALCGQIASYYRLAIQRNEGDVDKIVQAIKAIPLHLAANDENAEDYHRYCPLSAESWCQYQIAIFHKRETPHHPNYLSQGALKQIQSVFEDFKYDSNEFVQRVSGGHTSNQNESLHNLLYAMVRKTDAIGYNTMRLGSALAVIRYNEGFGGIQKLYKALNIEITPTLTEAFKFLDTKRLRSSKFIPKEQAKRFLKKTLRSKSTKAKIKKYGSGYSSGKYSAAQKTGDADSDMSSGEEVEQTPLPTSSKSKLSQENVDDSCAICSGTEDNGVVGVGLGLSIAGEEVHWVQCSSCNFWYHLLCLGMEITDIEGIEEWNCFEC